MNVDNSPLINVFELLKDVFEEAGEDNEIGITGKELHRLLKTFQKCANEDKNNHLEERQAAVELVVELRRKNSDLEEVVKEKSEKLKGLEKVLKEKSEKVNSGKELRVTRNTRETHQFPKQSYRSLLILLGDAMVT